MSQQTLPVFITDNIHLQPPTSTVAGSASTAYYKARSGSALALDSQGNAVTVDTQSQQSSTESNKSTSRSTDSANSKAFAYNGKCKQRKQFSEILRANLASEAAAVNMFAAQSRVGSQRPDLPYFQEKEKELLERLKKLAVQHRTRPSLMSPVVSASSAALGTLAGVLPRGLSDAIRGGVADALNEQYNDQLRDLRASGAADSAEAEPLREALRALRDQPRWAGSVKVPGLAELQRPKDLTLEEGVAGVVKLGFKGLVGLSSRI
ncbi:probable 5-demethoxyubiquinone hydroxylase, mitochondrial [Coccomyxa sp. Obi]|nr:probable 5-demethoxyubiquinone hydroxylase, mitochondrial [Coccomyxa sp. Obi]